MCFDEAVVDALQYPHAAFAPLWIASQPHSTRSKTIDDGWNHVAMTTEHGAIRDAVQQVEQTGVDLYVIAAELRQSLVERYSGVDCNGEWFDGFDTPAIRTRQHHAGRNRSEALAQVDGLSVSRGGEWTIDVVTVEVVARTGFGVSHEIQGHRGNLVGKGKQSGSASTPEPASWHTVAWAFSTATVQK